MTAQGRWRAPLIALICVPALAGPPYRTDDPEPVALDHVEAYAAWMGRRDPGGGSGTLPWVEANYGVLPDVHLHLGLGRAYLTPVGAPAVRGVSDAEVGVKVRILHETAFLPQIALYPALELPTGDPGRGLGAGHTQVNLPVWLQKSWGPWTTYGGYSWWRNPGAGQRNWTYAGWLLQRELSPALALGAEAFRQTAATVTGRPSVGGSLGAVVNLSERHHLLFSAGRNLSGDRETHVYLGYQFTAAAPARVAALFGR